MNTVDKRIKKAFEPIKNRQKVKKIKINKKQIKYQIIFHYARFILINFKSAAVNLALNLILIEIFDE